MESQTLNDVKFSIKNELKTFNDITIKDVGLFRKYLTYITIIF